MFSTMSEQMDVLMHITKKHGIVDINTTNPNFNIYTGEQGTRIIVIRRRGVLRIYECLVKGLIQQTVKETR